MVKRIIICCMCLMLLLGISVSAQREMPQGNPTSNIETPQGMPKNVADVTGDVQSQDTNQQQEQNGKAMTPPNMDFSGGNMPGGFGWNNAQAVSEPMTFTGFIKEYQTPIISVVLLAFAFVFVKLYKRKNY